MKISLDDIIARQKARNAELDREIESDIERLATERVAQEQRGAARPTGGLSANDRATLDSNASAYPQSPVNWRGEYDPTKHSAWGE